MAFCKNCGQPVVAQPAQQEAAPVAVEEPKGPWKVFAILGLVFGIVVLVLSWLGFPGLTIYVDAIVFSILGLRSKAKHGMAVAGLVLSIIAYYFFCMNISSLCIFFDKILSRV